MRDFTLILYKKLLSELIKNKYKFMTFAEYIQNPDKKERTIILRHDVDKKPLRSLKTAEMENKLQIKGTYYFRVVKAKMPSEEIERIAKLGHEIGYHYDDLNDAQGNVKNALELFKKNLAQLRELVPVKTACMHGSPLSRHDNRDLWKSSSYREFGIIGEPYFDIDFNEAMYLTDTGRRWDGDRVSIRDRVSSYRQGAIGDGQHKLSAKRNAGGSNLSVSSGTREVRDKREDRGQKTEDRKQNEKDSRGAVCSPMGTDQSYPPKRADDWSCNPPALQFHSTMDIIHALNENVLPDKIMLTIHPQRWNDNYSLWVKELIWQKIKNQIKYFMKKRMEKKINGK